MHSPLKRFVYFGMTHHRTLLGMCPKCGYPLDAVSPTPGNADMTRPPQAGDITLCAACSSVMIFQADGSRRLATRADMTQWPREVTEEVLRGKVAIMLALSLYGPPKHPSSGH